MLEFNVLEICWTGSLVCLHWSFTYYYFFVFSKRSHSRMANISNGMLDQMWVTKFYWRFRDLL